MDICDGITVSILLEYEWNKYGDRIQPCGSYGYEPNIHMEKDNKKMASYIYDWIDKECRK